MTGIADGLIRLPRFMARNAMLPDRGIGRASAVRAEVTGVAAGQTVFPLQLSAMA